MKIHADTSNAMVEFGLRQLEGLELDKLLTVLYANDKNSRMYLKEEAIAELGEQGYVLIRDDGGFTLIGQPCGLMYGMIDLADSVRMGLQYPLGLHKPRIGKRGIKFNIPLDARTPSYSDASDSAWKNIPVVWDISFWESLLDFLALHKYNLVSLWNLHPFPSMVKVRGFEEVALEDVKRTPEPVYGASCRGVGMYTRRHSKTLQTVKKMTIQQKIAFWRDVMAYGADRGISFYIFTWNVFVYGTEHTHYGITDDLSNPVTKEYFRRSVQALVETYPLLEGIGVTAGERMSSGRMAKEDPAGDTQWLWETYGRGINDAIGRGERPFRFIHRQHMCSVEHIAQTFEELKVPLDFSFKYSQAHMYSDPHPHFADKFFEMLPSHAGAWLTLRNDDMYMMRWGGVEFARTYLGGMPAQRLMGFLMGPDGYTIGLDFLSKDPKFIGMPVLKRQWYRTAIWGRLAYDVTQGNDYFIGLLCEQTGCAKEDAQRIFELSETVSMIIPIVNQVHWHDFDFENYPEANLGLDRRGTAMHMGAGVLYHGIHDYLLAPAQPGGSYQSVGQTGKREILKEKLPSGMKSPDDAVAELNERCDRAQGIVNAFDTKAQSEEYCALWEDCVSMMHLGRFYALQIACAMTVRRVYDGILPMKGQCAVRLAQRAAEQWERYVNHIMRRYDIQRLTRLNGRYADLYATRAAAWRNVEDVRMLMEAFMEI